MNRPVKRVLATSVGVLLLVAGGGPSARGDQQLGSPDFYPSADRPVGWRGDRTGRYPGATPPTQWSRRVAGLTSTIRYQAERPSGEPGPHSARLEYFTIKEWLVAGPFAVDDPVKGIDHDFLGGESRVEPATGAPAGSFTWQPLRAGVDTQSAHYHNEGTCGDLNVDFLYVFGRLPQRGIPKQLDVPLDRKVAYGHTYIYAPASGELLLRVNYVGAAARVFWNGRPVAARSGEPLKVSLNQGWNRLLVKVSSREAAMPAGQNTWVSYWRFAAYLEPVPPLAYQTRNIVWMTKMTGRSMSQPIVVGDRLYIGSGMTDLACIDKHSGRILWLRTNTPYDAMTAGGRAAPAEVREKVGPLAAKLDALSDAALRAINAAVSPTGLSSDEQAALDEKLKTRAEAERAVHNALAQIDRERYPKMYHNEVSPSNATPTSDGRRVYWACGGGMKGPGAYVLACFEPDGRRAWSWHDGGALGSLEHGNHISPLLAGGKLIYAANATLLAFDKNTGKELWRNKPDDWQNGGHGSNSPVLVDVGGQAAVVQVRYLHRLSDGTVICPSNLDLWGVLTPIVANNILYNPCRWRGWQDPAGFIAVRPPAAASPGAKCSTVLELDGREATIPIRAEGAIFMVASPLYVDGVVYSIEAGGGLAAVDVAAGKALYRRHLDGYNRYNRMVYGVAASPTLAGKYIYIIDDAGYTHVLEPIPRFGRHAVVGGRDAGGDGDARSAPLSPRGRGVGGEGGIFKEVAGNVLENIHLGGLGGNPCRQESFYTSPVFDGRRMYLRGEEYLYCIEEQ